MDPSFSPHGPIRAIAMHLIAIAATGPWQAAGTVISIAVA